MQVKLWLWSGSEWIEALADASGHLQVDILSSALPSGAATSAKQDTIIGHVDGIEGAVDGIEGLLAGGLPAALDTLSLKVKEQSPLTGFASALNQVTMITALQLIDDLRNALVSVATDQLRAAVISSALPTGAATEGSLATIYGRIGSAENPAAGTTNKLLTDILTAAQLIDDLRNALASVATDTMRVAPIPARGQYTIPTGATDRSSLLLGVSADDNTLTDVSSFTPASGKVVYLSFLNLGTLAGTGIIEVYVYLGGVSVAYLLGYNNILLNPNIPLAVATGDGTKVLLLQVRHHAGVTTTVRGAWQIWEV